MAGQPNNLTTTCCCHRSAPLPQKSEAQITQEIQAIIRQITASVTFLPLLQDKCECHFELVCWQWTCCSAAVVACSATQPVLLAGTIDLLAYTDKENAVPLDWEDSDPRYISNAADVKLRAFSTKVSCWGVFATGGWPVSSAPCMCT